MRAYIEAPRRGLRNRDGAGNGTRGLGGTILPRDLAFGILALAGCYVAVTVMAVLKQMGVF